MEVYAAAINKRFAAKLKEYYNSKYSPYQIDMIILLKYPIIAESIKNNHEKQLTK